MDTRSWLGVIGAISSATLVSGIPDVGLTVDDLTLRINEANGAYTNGATVDAAPLDWTTALDLNTNGTSGESPADQLTVGSIPIDLNGATLIVSGTANVQLFGMITGEVAFAFQQQTVSVDVDRDGTLELPVTGTAWARGPPGPDLQNATLTTFGLSVASGQTLTFGVGGVGFSVSAGSLALAIVTPSASAHAAGDGRSWLALDAQITSATFTGIPGLSLTVTGLTVEINRASGVYTDPTSSAAVSTQALNWTTSLDLDGDGVFGGTGDQLVVPIGGGGTVPIAFTGTTSLKITGTATISFDSLISGTVGFALATQTVTGTNIGGVTGLSSASLTTLAITATSLFVGWGTVGFQLTGGGLAIASLAPSTPDGRSWLGIQADLSSGSLMGVPGLTLTVSSLQVALNTATGASPLDWTKVQTGGVAVLDANGVTHTIAMTGDTPLVVSGNAAVDVAGLLGGSAHFVITQSTVDVASVGLTGATLLTVTLSNLQLAVGTSSIGAQISAGTLTIGLLVPAVSTDSRRWFGLSSSGISASLVLPSVTATVSNLSISVNEASGGATPLDWTPLNTFTRVTFRLAALRRRRPHRPEHLRDPQRLGTRLLRAADRRRPARQLDVPDRRDAPLVQPLARRRRDAAGRRQRLRADDHRRDAADRGDRAGGIVRRAPLDRGAGRRPHGDADDSGRERDRLQRRRLVQRRHRRRVGDRLDHGRRQLRLGQLDVHGRAGRRRHRRRLDGR